MYQSLEIDQHRSLADIGITDFRQLETLMLESRTDIEKGEKSYSAAERRRSVQGLFALITLLKLHDPQINRILGIDRFPINFEYNRDYVSPTGEHEIKANITVPTDCEYERIRGLTLEVRGVRVQVNMADREGEARAAGYLTQVGGGVRVGFRKGKLVGENTYEIENGEQILEEIGDEAHALAAAMLPKIMGLRFPKQIAEFLQTAKLDSRLNRKKLLSRAKDFYPSGGAKADIVIAAPELPEGIRLSQDEMTYIIGRAFYQVGYILGKKGAVGPDLDRMAGDVGSGVKHPESNKAVLNDLAEGVIAGVKEKLQEEGIKWTKELEQYYMATVTGKSGGFGLNAREEATGLGAWAAWLAYEQHYTRQNGIPIDANGIPAHMKGMRVFFRGCGNASYRTIKEAAKAGVVVHGIAERGALIISEDESGFTPDDANELYHISTEKKLGDLRFSSIADWAEWKMKQDTERKIRIIYKDTTGEAKKMDAETAEAVNRYFDDYKPQRIIEAAVQGTINYQNAERVPGGSVVVEIGNGPVTPQAGWILHKNGVVLLPGILVNSGGVDVSLFESIRNILRIERLDKEDIEQSLVRLMSQNIADLFALRDYYMKRQKELEEMVGARGELPLESLYYALAMARAINGRNELHPKIFGVRVSGPVGTIYRRVRRLKNRV